MTSERELMIRGGLYDPADAELVAARMRARQLARAYNDAEPADDATRARLLVDWLGGCGRRVRIEPPFRCDYGWNLFVGDDVYFNFGAVVLDCAPIRLGDRVLAGPNVQLLAATHPVEASVRRTGRELARPIAIGDDVWIGGGAIILPGVTVGARSVIGAGSVVARDLPADVVAAGNPCRVLRAIADPR